MEQRVYTSGRLPSAWVQRRHPMLLAALLATVPDLKVQALDLLDRVTASYAIEGSDLFREENGAGTSSQVAYNWSVGVMLSAMVSAAEVEPARKAALVRYANATRIYWNPAGPVPGYDVLPMPKPVDRYYDDNAWMVLALVDVYRLTRDRKYLGWASEAMAYVMSGADEKLGGGICWRESDRGASKNTCSNAPSAAALLALYEVDLSPERLRSAQDLYEWTYKTLRDPADGLMWDNISADGSIGKAKWSYNTALMIRAATCLYRFTKKPAYRDEALAFEEASVRHWVTEDGALRCDGKFGHLLLDAWAYRARFIRRPAGRAAVARKVLSTVSARFAGANGWFGSRWDSAPSGTKRQLIDQAAFIRAALVNSR